MKYINLTWTAKNYSGNILDIKVRFDYPLKLSPLTEQDELVVWINENQTFFKQNKSPFAYLHEESTILSVTIPKQQRDSELMRYIDFANLKQQ